MHELKEYTDTAAAVWVTPGGWAVVLRDGDTLVGEGRLLLEPAPECWN